MIHNIRQQLESVPLYKNRGNYSISNKMLRVSMLHQLNPDVAFRRRITTFTNSERDHVLHRQQQSRHMAFITGHAKTKRKNKKRRAAKARAEEEKRLRAKVMTDEEFAKYKQKKQLQRQEDLARMKAKKAAGKKKSSFDPSKTPNYPLGPQGLEDVIENEDGTTTIITPEERAAAADAREKKVVTPPAVLLPTGSPHVFVAKVACQELNIEPRTQLFSSTQIYLRHDPKLRTVYTFEPYGPLFARSTVNTTKKNHNLEMSDKPEVAFLGRSNVGKSSLVNALMNKTLAVTSKQPGRTQQAYYYGWIPSRVLSSFLPKDSSLHATTSTSTTSSLITSLPIAAVTGFWVDLPGYGFAVGPDSAVETWQVATQDYLRQRRDVEALKRVYVLQDARLQTPQQIDGDVLRWLEDEEIPHTVVLTKADDHHTIMNKTGSTIGVIKHANLCCLRYHQLWFESGATIPDHDESEADSSDNESVGDVQEDSNSAEDHDDDREYSDEPLEEEVEEEEMVGTIMLSPVVHVTSSKKQTGLAELLASVESEFVAEQSV